MSFKYRNIGSDALLNINGVYKLARIERKFPLELTSDGSMTYRYLGYIYHNNTMITVTFTDEEIESDENYEKHRKISKNLNIMMDIFEDDVT